MAWGVLRTSLVAATARRTARSLSSSYSWALPRGSTVSKTTGLTRQQSSSRIVVSATTAPPLVLGRGYSALRSSNRADDDDEKKKGAPSSPIDSTISFVPGHKIQVEVISFGPLGASVDVVADSHDADDVIPEDASPLGQGLILQKEIAYFRQGRNNVDVVRGEILPAYVERTREDGRHDIALRAFGGKAKALDLSQKILQALTSSPAGEIAVGDKSPPGEINAVFPGTSKSAFKKAVAMLYKEGKVQPGPNSIRLM